jgi:hypothetical protein
MEETPMDTKGALAAQKVKGLQVEVSLDNIETALPANSGHCMVSDAVKDSAKKKGWRIGKVLTDLQTIRFTDLKKKLRIICFTPREAQLALLKFDQGVKPEPFVFRLKPVQIISKAQRAVKAKDGQPSKAPAKPRLATRPTNKGGYTRPIKHGGPSLPITVGLRREFGLRQMGVWTAPSEPATAGEVS